MLQLNTPIYLCQMTLKHQRNQQIRSFKKRAQELLRQGNAVISYEDFLVHNPVKSQGRLILEMLGMVASGLVLGAAIGGGYDLISGSSLTPILGGSVGSLVGLLASFVSAETAQNLPIDRYEKYLKKKEAEYLEKAKPLHVENIVSHDYVVPAPPGNFPNQPVNQTLGRS